MEKEGIKKSARTVMTFPVDRTCLTVIVCLLAVICLATVGFAAPAGTPGIAPAAGKSNLTSLYRPVITTEATITFVDLEGGFFGIIGSDGSKYEPTKLSKAFLKDGLPVTVKLAPAAASTGVRMWGTPVTVLSIRERTVTPLLPPDTLVLFERTGGFAGVSDRMEVYRNGTVTLTQRGGNDRFSLEPALLDDLRSALTQSGFQRLRDRYQAQKPVPDAFLYRITCEGKTVSVEEPAVPPALKPVLSLLDVIMNTPNQGSGSQGTPFSGSYRLTGIRSGLSAISNPVPATNLTLTLEPDGSLSGSAGCNSYGGTYTAGSGGSIQFGPIYATEMYCRDEDVMKQEESFLALLGKTTRFALENEIMTGYDRFGARTMVLQKIPEPLGSLPAGVTGKVWEVVRIRSTGGTLAQGVKGSKITLEIGRDGTLSGCAGCNTYGGTITSTKDAQVRVSPLFSTKMYCGAPPGVMEQESRYLSLLRAAESFTLDNGSLTISGPAGSPSITFREKSMETGTTIRGTIRYIDLEGGFYGIVTDSGDQFLPENLGDEWQKDGLQVLADVVPGSSGVSIFMWGKDIRILSIRKA